MSSGNVTKTHLVRIGNSRGVRIPKIWLDQLALRDEVEMTVQADRLVIRSAGRPRQDWDDRFRAMHETGDDRPIESFSERSPSAWDEQEWQW
jgi:antitoxin MazE